MSLGENFHDYSVRKLRQQSVRVVECLDRMSEEQIWTRLRPALNSPANLVLHLEGNVRQWILSGVAGAPDTRDRDAEFLAGSGVDRSAVADRSALQARLTQTVKAACTVIVGLSDSRLTERITVQGYDVSVLEAVYHVVEHFSGHAGQLIWIAKYSSNQGFKFYSHLESEHGQATP
jgi:hypothetical protein